MIAASGAGNAVVGALEVGVAPPLGLLDPFTVDRVHFQDMVDVL